MKPTHAADVLKTNLDRFVAQSARLRRIPSISGDPKRAEDVQRCAEWLAKQLHGAGFARVHAFPHRDIRLSMPILAARGVVNRRVRTRWHYDVQPAEPLQDWKSPPFYRPVSPMGFCTGAARVMHKGQIFIHLKALETLQKTRGRLPINVKCLFEAKRKSAVRIFPAFLTRNRRALKPTPPFCPIRECSGPTNRADLFFARTISVGD